MQTDQQRQDGLVITSAVLTTLSLMIVITRSVIRMGIIKKPGWDDYTILVAMFFMCGYFAEILVARENGIGMPTSSLSVENILNFVKVTLAIQCTYYTCVAFIKISILCMYLRFAASPTLRYLSIGTIIFHAAFFLICIAGTLAQCRPLHKMWDLLGTVPGSCINTTAFFYFTSGFNIVTDLWIIALPIKTLIKINRPQKEKVALVVIFGIGIFATIMSIVRLHTIYKYTLAKDLVREGILVNLWSVIEINASIICASVPALKPLFTPKELFALHDSLSPNPHTKRQNYSSDSRDAQSPNHPCIHIRSKQSVEQWWSERGGPLANVEETWTRAPGEEAAVGIPRHSAIVTAGPRS